MKKSLIVALLSVIILIMGGCTTGGDPAGAVVPDHIKTVNEDTLNLMLEELKGKVVVVDMWATWCGPCKMQIKPFIELTNEYKDKDFALITLCHRKGSSGSDMKEDDLKAFMKEKGINYPVYFLSNDFFQKPLFASEDGNYAFPTTLFYDRDGNMVEKHIGFATKSFFVKRINSLLGEVDD